VTTVLDILLVIQVLLGNQSTTHSTRDRTSANNISVPNTFTPILQHRRSMQHWLTNSGLWPQ